ncbi:MAG TPA: 4Fe-4S dicluster domain-containing protein [Candidatus Sumerlaeota bacterium]|nr:4Fe-4S dicluster domain-containing protein [Candidatus Sumerlaeota bacterium]
MNMCVIKKDELNRFLAAILETHRLFAPVREGAGSLYRTVERPEDVCLDFLRPLRSAKEIFFPQNEVLFYFNQRTQKSVEPAKDDRPAVLFGVTPCDLAGIAAQDRLFTGGAYQDAYYQRKRSNTVIVGMACPEPGPTCFCNAFGIDRFASALADLMFIPLDDVYLINVNTEAGAKLVTSLAEASPADLERLEVLKNRETGFTMEIPDLETLSRALADEFDADFWDDISQRCIGCAACAYVCPTCHCFDITDETAGDLGRRVRTWDGCMASRFTMHASGHNPRTRGGQRMRQRILHKFSYFMENQGCLSCTGCGRCIDLCPVGMDLREILRRIAGDVLQPAPGEK